MKNETEVGWFQTQVPVVICREPEVGLAWMAEARGLGQAALGATPDEAARNLLSALNDRGFSGTGQVDDKKLRRLARADQEED